MADDVPEHLKEIIQIRTQQAEKLSEELRMTPSTAASWTQLDADIESIEKEIERLKNSRTYEQFGRHPSADAAHSLGEGIGKGNLRDLRRRYRDVEDAIGSPHHRAVVENLDPRLRQVLEAEGGEAFRVMPRYLQHSPPETQKLFADFLERTEPSYMDVGFPQGQMDDPSWTRTYIQGNTPAVNITLTPGHGGSAEVLNMENIAKPGQARGAGRSFLREITDLADKNQANMTLTAAPYSSGRGGQVGRSRLQQMYGDLGFEEYYSIGAVGNDSPGMVPLRQNDIYPMVREPRPEASRRAAMGDPRFPHIKQKKNLTPTEQRFFLEMSENMANRRELHEAGIRLSRDGKTVYIEDADRAIEYIDETYLREARPGGPGTSTVPPSFRTGGRGSFASGIIDVAADEYVDLGVPETLREIGMRTEGEQAARRTRMPDTPDPPGAAGVFERQRRKAAEATEATPELTPEMRAEEQRVRELEQTIYEQDRRLSDLNPDSPAARDAKRKKAAAKALLRGMGRTAGLFFGPALALAEGVAYAQDVAEEGPVQGTRTFFGEGVEGTGALASGMESLTERESIEEMMGYPTSPTTKAMRLGGDVAGAVGRGLGAVGRFIRGSGDDDDEKKDTSIIPLDDMAKRRAKAAALAFAQEREKKE